MKNRESLMKITIIIITVLISIFMIVGGTGCVTSESTFIIEPSDSNNYNTYILP